MALESPGPLPIPCIRDMQTQPLRQQLPKTGVSTCLEKPSFRRVCVWVWVNDRFRQERLTASRQLCVCVCDMVHAYDLSISPKLSAVCLHNPQVSVEEPGEVRLWLKPEPRGTRLWAGRWEQLWRQGTGVGEIVAGGRERLCPQRRPGLKQEAPSEWPPDPLLGLPGPRVSSRGMFPGG